MDYSGVLDKLLPLFSGAGGLDSWLQNNPHTLVKERLESLSNERSPLSHSELDQLLILSGFDGISAGFFRFYWTTKPVNHPYDVDSAGKYQETWESTDEIVSLDHFIWGWTRFYIDALLYFGDLDRAYDRLSSAAQEELEKFFMAFRVSTEDMRRRGRRMLVKEIPQDDRYLIAELACKTLEGPHPLAADALIEAYDELHPGHDKPIRIQELVTHLSGGARNNQATSVQYSFDEMLQIELQSRADLETNIENLTRRFNSARNTALLNTELYLSMAGELDVYVATSMRTRTHFRDMARLCSEIFDDPGLKDLNVRYFDPTMSAASGHEDKGLIECLMVRSCQALVYTAGDRDSWGKDAEAAMALSLGKPVIFFCSEETRRHIFDEIHPLSRLISFRHGVAVGAMIVSKPSAVVLLLQRIFTNKMRYKLRGQEQHVQNHLRLEEEISGTTVRLQSSDNVLRKAIRNTYQSW